MTLLEHLGKRIRGRREARGLKQADIARALQVSAQAVSKWERGENAPDIAQLAPLARLLDLSLDRLLGATDEEREVFEATVFVSGTSGYALKAQAMPPRDLAAWVNALFYRLTETALRSDGVPVKQTGDGLLCFFSGPRHRERAIEAARRSVTGGEETVAVALTTGQIYLGALGHPDYARPDIIGDPVNVAFGLLAQVSGEERKIVVADAATVDGLSEVTTAAPKTYRLGFMPTPVTGYELAL
ncbi:MAG: helix-turn-helix domain-containing protein [Nitrospinae bacterium]|nr:helix-turn-helix domain-containing protein [Nitrospinota bacterium]